MKNSFFLIAGSLFGALAVIIGAFGAHGLKKYLDQGLLTEQNVVSFDTGVKYQMYHSIVLLIVFFLMERESSKWLTYSGWLFICGILLFSGSIYFLSTRGISNLSVGFLGPVTPVGGLLFVAGWLTILIYALTYKK